jgi:hypothetical protein
VRLYRPIAARSCRIDGAAAFGHHGLARQYRAGHGNIALVTGGTSGIERAAADASCQVNHEGGSQAAELAEVGALRPG